MCAGKFTLSKQQMESSIPALPRTSNGALRTILQPEKGRAFSIFQIRKKYFFAKTIPIAL